MHPTDPELESFLEETLDADTNALIDSHVAECSECQSRVERLIDSTFGVPKVSTSLPRSSTVNPGDTQTPDGQASKAIDQANIDLRFVIVDELASGGMGTVYRGFDRDFKREVAIKIAHQTTGETSAIRFYREAQISGQLQHPGIVPVHQTGRLTDGRQYIAMKLVKGRTLSSVIHETKESQPARLFSVFGDVCNTMAYAHSRDIIHRDLKPENIMVGAFGEVQIMDWGLARQLARVVDEATSPNFLSGRALAPGTARLPTSNATGSAGAERTDIESTGGAAGTLDAAQMPGLAPTRSQARTCRVRQKKAMSSALQRTCLPNKLAVTSPTNGPTCSHSAAFCLRSSRASRRSTDRRHPSRCNNLLKATLRMRSSGSTVPARMKNWLRSRKAVWRRIQTTVPPTRRPSV